MDVRTKQVLQVGAAAAAAMTVLGALWVGVAWMNSVLPATSTLPIEAETAAPNTAPPLASIPWKRDPDDLERVTLTPAWYPWDKPPAVVRPVNGGWWPRGRERGRLDPARVEEISKKLASGDAAVQQATVAEIAALLPQVPQIVGGRLRGPGSPWARPLIAAKRYPELESLTGALLIPVAADTPMLEGVLALRARVLLLEGKADAAIGCCRQWFAVSSLIGTAQALAATEQALVLEHPKDKAVASRRLRAALGIGPTTTSRPASDEAVFSLCVDADASESAPFVAAARAMVEEDFGSLMARGNLYLLGGRPDLAENVFRRAYMEATDAQAPAAVEGLARCEKARSGNIVAANARLMEGPR